MANCRQACPYNTLDGCKVKEYNAICPLTNMSKPITEYKMTNADRIRAMSDEELAKLIAENAYTGACNDFGIPHQGQCCHNCERCDAIIKWLKQPAE